MPWSWFAVILTGSSRPAGPTMEPLLIINKITELIAKDPHATLRAISINAAEGVFDGNITVLIDNTEHLSQLISRLKHLEGVVRVNRHDSMLED